MQTHEPIFVPDHVLILVLNLMLVILADRNRKFCFVSMISHCNSGELLLNKTVLSTKTQSVKACLKHTQLQSISDCHK